MTPIDEMLDALTQRALDLLDARLWLQRIAGKKTSRPMAPPEMPVVDDDGDPVVVALMWRSYGGPSHVAEFEAGARRFRVFSVESGMWTEMPEDLFEPLLRGANDDGDFEVPEPPMDTRGVIKPSGGDVGLQVIRGGQTIPVDPDVGLAPSPGAIGRKPGSLGEEAERFLKEQTRGDGE